MHRLPALEHFTQQLRPEFGEFGLDYPRVGVHDLFYLVDEDYLLGGIGYRPDLSQTLDQRDDKLGLFIQEVLDTRLELGVERGEGLHFVEGDHYFQKEFLMFALQRTIEPGHNGSHDLQHLNHSIMNLSVIPCQSKHDIHDLYPNAHSQAHELAIHPMHNGLEVISLPGVFAIEQIEHLLDECRGYVRCNSG